MGIKSIFKIFQKGAKAAKKARGAKGTDGFVWPPGIRIGVYGHANAGKTVYFTVLNEDCKISKKLQISVTDNATAGEFLTNYRGLWGVGTATGSGTVVDLRGEKKFPNPTVTEKLLQFNAIVDRKKKVSVVTYDYSGKAVSISDRDTSAEKVADFMAGCDGILFFFDSKVMGAELECQAHAASFVNMLEQLAPLRARLPIPVALVVTKADTLEGFAGDDQVTLVPPEDEYIVSEDFELFLEKVLGFPKVAASSVWTGTVRNVLIKLKDFLRVVVGRTLDFQVFFISATGQKPEKIGTDIGRSLYAPPAKMQPVGVKEPFYWLLHSILRNRRVSAFRTVARFVRIISLIWIVLASLPFLFHFLFLYPQPQKVESRIRAAYGGSMYSSSKEDRDKIIMAYKNYERSATVKWFFEEFQLPASQIWNAYSRYDKQEAEKDLDKTIDMFARIVADTTKWPAYNPGDGTVIPREEHTALQATLDNYHKGDETSILFVRSGRTLMYWNLFLTGVGNPTDTTVWQKIQMQVKTDRTLQATNLSEAEMRLGDALMAHKIVKVQEVVAAQAATELGDLIKTINSKPSPDFRLDTAVTQLQELKASLNPAVDRAGIAMIDKYLAAAEIWSNARKFKYKVVSVPGEGHLHVEVVSRGKDPTWAVHETQVPGHEYTISWASGDAIYIALDTLGQAEDWGDQASDKVRLGGKFSIFAMDGDIRFENIGKKVTITFIPGLWDQIPKLEK
ncbi:MAG: hypothetical protein GYA46_00445 [candidate division Zixibacteria bacterium]|nr:hypothetical protein [candidate division Zixibacteria bacterium]